MVKIKSVHAKTGINAVCTRTQANAVAFLSKRSSFVTNAGVNVP